MVRRCYFLDNLPAFNYNAGVGELIKGEDGRLTPTNTEHLGSTLMSTMLEEVGNFCDPAIKMNWTRKSHQQVNVGKNCLVNPENSFLSTHPPPHSSSYMTFVMEEGALDSFPFDQTCSQMKRGAT